MSEAPSWKLNIFSTEKRDITELIFALSSNSRWDTLARFPWNVRIFLEAFRSSCRVSVSLRRTLLNYMRRCNPAVQRLNRKPVGRNTRKSVLYCVAGCISWVGRALLAVSSSSLPVSSWLLFLFLPFFFALIYRGVNQPLHFRVRQIEPLMPSVPQSSEHKCQLDYRSNWLAVSLCFQRSGPRVEALQWGGGGSLPLSSPFHILQTRVHTHAWTNDAQQHTHTHTHTHTQDDGIHILLKFHEIN